MTNVKEINVDNIIDFYSLFKKYYNDFIKNGSLSFPINLIPSNKIKNNLGIDYVSIFEAIYFAKKTHGKIKYNTLIANDKKLLIENFDLIPKDIIPIILEPFLNKTGENGKVYLNDNLKKFIEKYFDRITKIDIDLNRVNDNKINIYFGGKENVKNVVLVTENNALINFNYVTKYLNDKIIDDFIKLGINKSATLADEQIHPTIFTIDDFIKNHKKIFDVMDSVGNTIFEINISKDGKISIKTTSSDTKLIQITKKDNINYVFSEKKYSIYITNENLEDIKSIFRDKIVDENYKKMFEKIRKLVDSRFISDKKVINIINLLERFNCRSYRIEKSIDDEKERFVDVSFTKKFFDKTHNILIKFDEKNNVDSLKLIENEPVYNNNVIDFISFLFKNKIDQNKLGIYAEEKNTILLIPGLEDVKLSPSFVENINKNMLAGIIKILINNNFNNQIKKAITKLIIC